MAVRLDAAALVHLNASFFQAKPVGKRLAPGCDEHNVSFKSFSFAALGGLKRDRSAVTTALNGGNLGTELECEALLGKQALELLGDFAIHAAEDGVQILDDCDFRAEASPDRAKLQTDDTTANDDQLFRHLVQRKRAGGRDNRLLIEIDVNARDTRNFRTGGDDDVLRIDALFCAIFSRHDHLPGTGNSPRSAENCDLVLLHKEVEALDVLLDRLAFMREHLFQVELHAIQLNAEILERMLGFRIHFGRMQQGFGRDAAHVYAGAAMVGQLLHYGGLEAQLGCLDRADIASRPGSDHDDIELLWHAFSCLSCWEWSATTTL